MFVKDILFSWCLLSSYLIHIYFSSLYLCTYIYFIYIIYIDRVYENYTLYNLEVEKNDDDYSDMEKKWILNHTDKNKKNVYCVNTYVVYSYRVRWSWQQRQWKTRENQVIRMIWMQNNQKKK